MIEWNLFPRDIKSKILSFLSIADLNNFEKTSKLVPLLSDEYFLWKQQCYHLYKKEAIFHKAVACHLFLDNLQTCLEYINDYHIKCGCNRCTDYIGGNYPDYEENYIENGYPSKQSSNGQMIKEDGVCLLYQWFKTLCAEFNCPIPDDDVDNPFIHPRSWDISTCLGKGIGDDVNGDHICGSSISSHHHWRYYIKNMTFEQQKNTVYKMMHAMSDHHNYFASMQLESSFESWFSIKECAL